MSESLVKIENNKQYLNAGSSEVIGFGNDENVINAWLNTKRSPGTIYQYKLAKDNFFSLIPKPIQSINIEDIIKYAESLSEFREATQFLRMSAIKSLFTFCHKTGYVKINVAAFMKSGQSKDTIHERLLTEEQVLTMLMHANTIKHRCLIRVLYRSGGRITEVLNLKWSDLVVKPDCGILTLFGKGEKTRHVKIPTSLVNELLVLKDGSDTSERIFNITRQRAWVIIKSIAKKAGVSPNCSAHWFRHSHATHAIDHNVPIKLLSDTLGHASIETTSRYIHANPEESSSDYLKIG